MSLAFSNSGMDCWCTQFPRSGTKIRMDKRFESDRQNMHIIEIPMQAVDKAVWQTAMGS